MIAGSHSFFCGSSCLICRWRIQNTTGKCPRRTGAREKWPELQVTKSVPTLASRKMIWNVSTSDFTMASSLLDFIQIRKESSFSYGREIINLCSRATRAENIICRLKPGSARSRWQELFFSSDKCFIPRQRQDQELSHRRFSCLPSHAKRRLTMTLQLTLTFLKKYRIC